MPTFSSSITDILTRVNTNNNPEHYGVCDDGGSIAMFKLDNSGNNSINPDEFHYTGGGLGYWPYGNVKVSGLDGYGIAKDGVQIFAPFNSQHLIKTYFNGVSGCSETHTTMTTIHQGPSFVGNSNISRTQLFPGCANVFSLNVFAITPTISTICTATTLGAGSNAKIGKINYLQELNSSQLNLVQVAPNPSSGKTTLKFIGTNVIDKIEVINAIGQIILVQKISKEMQGEEIDLNLQSLLLEEGVYYLKVSTPTGERNYKLIFKY